MWEWTGLTWPGIGTCGGIFMNVVMNVQIPYTVGNFVTIWDVLSSPGFCSTELVTLKRAFKMSYF